MLVLLGIGVVVLGFVLRANPLLVVMAAALTTGLAAAWTPTADLMTMYAAARDTLAASGIGLHTDLDAALDVVRQHLAKNP